MKSDNPGQRLVCTVKGQRFVHRLQWCKDHRGLAKVMLTIAGFVMLEGLVVLATIDAYYRYPGGLSRPWFAMVVIGTVAAGCLALMPQFELENYLGWRWQRLRRSLDILVLDDAVSRLLTSIAAKEDFHPTIEEMQALLYAKFAELKPILKSSKGLYAAISTHEDEWRTFFAAARAAGEE